MSCLCGLFQGLRLKEMLCLFCLFCFAFLAKYPVLARGWIVLLITWGSLLLPSPWSQQNSSRCCFQLETQKWLHMNVYMQTISVSVCVHMYICMHMYTYVNTFILCLYSRANTYMYSKWWALFLPCLLLVYRLFVLFLSILTIFQFNPFLKRVAIKFYGLSLYLFSHTCFLFSSVAFFVFTLNNDMAKLTAVNIKQTNKKKSAVRIVDELEAWAEIKRLCIIAHHRPSSSSQDIAKISTFN